MKKLILVLILLSITSCYKSRSTSDIRTYTPLPLKVDTNPTKEGKACRVFIFPVNLLVLNYDISVETARLKGNITDIVSIEEEKTIILPFFIRSCTVVKGN